MKRLTISLLLIQVFCDGFSQDQLVKQFVDYHQSFPTEKVYLHTSREMLTLGDTLYFSAYVLRGLDHRPSQVSGLLHVELIAPDGKKQKRKLKVGPLGRSYGDFELSGEQQPGTYTLRAFTNYQLNFDDDYIFSKSIRVLPPAAELVPPLQASDAVPKIQFDLFPQGGDLIAGQYNYMAFKVTDEFGGPIDVSGEVVNSQGDPVMGFESKHDGMGLIQMLIEEGERYTCTYKYAGVVFTTPVPQPLSSGYLLNVRNADDRVIVMVIGHESAMDSTFMVVQCRGELIHALKPRPGAPFLQFAIPRSELPTGIVQLTFFDADHRAVAERLIYNENPDDDTNLVIHTDRKTFKKRSKVEVGLTLEHAEETEPPYATVSTTVLPKTLFVSPEETLASYLLFTSDLKGRVHEPAYYLDPQNPDRLDHIDLLMMTHGWRRFDWEQVANGEAPVIEHPIEKGISVQGQVTSHINRNKGVASELYLSFLEDPLTRLDTVSTEDGFFWFDGLAFSDTLRAYVKTQSDKAKKRQQDKVKWNTFIKISENPSPPVVVKPEMPQYVTPVEEVQIRRAEKLFDIAAAFDEKTIILDEMTVRSSREDEKDPFKSRGIIYGEPDSRIMLDSLPQGYLNVFDYLYGLPGVRVQGVAPNQTLVIRGTNSINGNNTPLYLLNGFPTDEMMVNNLPVQDVLFIDVLRGASAAVYGSRAGGGVVAVYTRRGGEHRQTPESAPIGLTAFSLAGFSAPRSFYMPNYNDPTEQERIRPDYRSTIYWNPLLQVRGGSAEDSFYTSDETGEFIIYSEGVSVDGRIYTGMSTFQVK